MEELAKTYFVPQGTDIFTQNNANFSVFLSALIYDTQEAINREMQAINESEDALSPNTNAQNQSAKGDAANEKKEGSSLYTLSDLQHILKLAQKIAAMIQGLGDEFSDDFIQTLHERLAKIDIDVLSDMSIGRAHLFRQIFVDCLCFVPEKASWFWYNENHWEKDAESMLTMRCGQKLVIELMKLNLKKLLNHGVEAQLDEFISSASRREMVNEASSMMAVPFSNFDSDDMLLNCLNGTLDLRTNELRDHNPHDYITKVAGCYYDPDADSPRFQKFISDIMIQEDDPDCSNAKAKASFLQDALGYALTGSTSEECMFILYGKTTRNGKSTLMEAVKKVMGTYARSADPKTLSAKKIGGGSGPSEDIARLNGARMVTFAEPPQGMVFNVAGIKTLTGGDTISARFLHENSVEFKAKCKMFVNTNYLPAVSDQTLFSSGRVHVIEFNRHFTQEEQDKTLKATLEQPQNLSAILNWLLEGCQHYHQFGLLPPVCVQTATQKYQEENDNIGRFVRENMVQASPDTKTRLSEIYSIYQNWSVDEHEDTAGQKDFKQRLSQLGISIDRKRPSCGGEKTTVVIGYIMKLVGTEGCAVA